MFSRIYSAGTRGIEGQVISVEVDSHDGLPGIVMVGYLSSEVREAQERVRTAIRNSGFRIPPKKTVINLSPVSIRKAGTSYDLAIALAVLSALGEVNLEPYQDCLFVGELGLDGRIKPVRGILPIILTAEEKGFRQCFLPRENLAEGHAGGCIRIAAPSSLKECVEWLRYPEKMEKIQPDMSELLIDDSDCSKEIKDFSEVNGQLVLRRGAEIAAAGRHNLLMIGEAGAGKTMVAQRIPTIMPPMTKKEIIEVSKIYSVCGLLPNGQTLITRRPFRNPHHTISPQALAGGGVNPKPGELSLASEGILFLDEFPEFSSKAIEILRQPLEEKSVTISRIHGTYVFPARILLVAAMNPCPCGFWPDRNRCRCSEGQIQHYIGRISKPILDRFDITAEAAPVSYQELRYSQKNECSKDIRSRVEAARERQAKRFQNQSISYNSEMGGKEIEEYCKISSQEETFLEAVYRKKQLSARGVHKILKVARTIADLNGQESIDHSALCEAIGYRSLETKYWGKEGQL